MRPNKLLGEPDSPYRCMYMLLDALVQPIVQRRVDAFLERRHKQWDEWVPTQPS